MPRESNLQVAARDLIYAILGHEGRFRLDGRSVVVEFDEPEHAVNFCNRLERLTGLVNKLNEPGAKVQ